MPLSDSAIEDAKPGIRNGQPVEGEYQIADGGGLSLVVRKEGTKTWRYEYRMGGKKRKLILGNYPELCASEARKIHAEAKKLVQSGQDPLGVLETPQSRRKAADTRGIEGAKPKRIAKPESRKKDADQKEGMTEAPEDRLRAIVREEMGQALAPIVKMLELLTAGKATTKKRKPDSPVENTLPKPVVQAEKQAHPTAQMTQEQHQMMLVNAIRQFAEKDPKEKPKPPVIANNTIPTLPQYHLDQINEIKKRRQEKKELEGMGWEGKIDKIKQLGESLEEAKAGRLPRRP